MRARRIGGALIAGFAMVFTGALSAQQRQMTAPTLQPDPNLNSEDQLAPSQVKQPMPAAVATPGSAPTHPARHAATEPALAHGHGMPARLVIACSGPFGKDSSMLELAMVFDSRNMIFTEENVKGSQVGATVLFPKDPKRRLEVWWSDPNRSGLYLIDIADKSMWTAPGGLRLGLTLQELERLNHKSFKLKGFDKDNVATVSDWDGGALARLAGGCKSGVSLQVDPKAHPHAAVDLPADHDYSSADPAMRALKPKVSEVLIGY